MKRWCDSGSYMLLAGTLQSTSADLAQVGRAGMILVCRCDLMRQMSKRGGVCGGWMECGGRTAQAPNDVDEALRWKSKNTKVNKRCDTMSGRTMGEKEKWNLRLGKIFKYFVLVVPSRWLGGKLIGPASIMMPCCAFNGGVGATKLLFSQW